MTQNEVLEWLKQQSCPPAQLLVTALDECGHDQTQSFVTEFMNVWRNYLANRSVEKWTPDERFLPARHPTLRKTARG